MPGTQKNDDKERYVGSCNKIVEEKIQEARTGMKIAFLFVFALVTLSFTSFAFAQQSPNYLSDLNRKINDCGITHMYSTKMYVPISVKVYHDATPDFLVKTNATDIGSQITTNGDSPVVYLITTNSTSQFTFNVVANYHDGKEHPIAIEYWSQNTPVSYDSWDTINGTFCRTIFVDTAVAPQIPDYRKQIQTDEALFLQNLIKVIGDNTNVTGKLAIAGIVFDIIIGIAYLIGIVHRRNESDSRIIEKERHERMMKKGNELNDALQLVINHTLLNENNRDKLFKNAIQEMGTLPKMFESSVNKMAVDIRTIFFDVIGKGLSEEDRQKIKNATDKLVEKKIEDVVTSEPIVESGAKGTSPTMPKKDKSLLSVTFGKKKDVTEKVITEKEYYDMYSKNKDTGQLRKIYDSIEEELKKKYNESMANEANALVKIITERAGT